MFKRSLCVLISAFCTIAAFNSTAAEAVKTEPLLCFVGGTMRPGMEKLAALYEKQTGVKVLLDYAESGQQLIKISQTKKGDLFIAHDPYRGATEKKNLLDKAWTATGLTGVIVVAKGNPKKITAFSDLARPGIKVILTDSVYSTLGHVVEVIKRKSGLGAKVEANVVTRTKSSGEAANAISLGNGDAAIVWNAVAFLRSDKLDAIPLDAPLMPVKGVDAITSATFGPIDMSFIRVWIMTLQASKQKAAARKFAEFVASKEAAAVWIGFGFSPVPPPPAAVSVKTEITVLCAAGMRSAVEILAREFEKQSATTVHLSYDGSNRLLGQLELTRKGDVYISGDAEYMTKARAKGLVARTDTICVFAPVLLVKKTSAIAINSLADCLKPKVKLGQGDEKAAAIGPVTLEVLDKNNIGRDAWKKNVVLVTPTVNELAMAVKLGTIDAAVVWDAIAAPYKESARIVTIPDSLNVFAAVEGAVLTVAKEAAGAAAFLDFIVSASGKKILAENGYRVTARKSAQ